MAKRYGFIQLLNAICDYSNSRVKAAITSALPAGTALLGKVGIDQATANANEVVVKSITAGTSIVGKVGIDQSTANANEVVVKSITAGTTVIGAVKDAGPNWTAVGPTYATIGAAADQTLWTPGSGKKFVVTDIILSVDAASTVTLKDGTTTKIVVPFAANGGMVVNLKTHWQSATADNILKWTNSAGNAYITVFGYEV